MSEPRLHVRLIDELGVVYVDRDITIDTVDTGLDHSDIAKDLTARGIRWRLEITDPDDEIGPVILEGGGANAVC